MAVSATVPESIGNFRILSKLGQGGMGAVYRAVHGTLERPVALKVLPGEFSNNPEYVTRFLREARTIATLSHKNIVHVYDAGETNGQYYIAMELIDGCNVLQYAEEKRLSEKEALDLLLQAARGLAAAHEKGLVHRDIKPENMLVGSDGMLRLVDFGLVMESASSTQLTATGACLGTPMYMSPEQADGEQADHRTDIYSLGVSFYRVFTGQTPFTSPTVMNLLFKHKFEAPPNPKRLRSELSADVCNLLLRMISKRREDRPQSAAELAAMIEGIGQGRHVPEPPPFRPVLAGSGSEPTLIASSTQALSSAPSVSATPRVPSRNRLIFAGAGMLCIGVVTLVLTRGTAPESKLTDPRVNDGALGDSAFVAGRLEEALERYRSASSAEPENPLWKEKVARTDRLISFNARMQAGEQFETRGDYDGAIREYSNAMVLDEGSVAKDRLESLKAKWAEAGKLSSRQKQDERDRLSALGEQAERAKNWPQAAEYFARAANLSDEAVRSAFADRAAECRRQSYVEKGLAAESQKNYSEAESLYKKAQTVKFDPAVARQLENVQKAQNPALAAASEYDAAMHEGEAALKAGKFKDARLKFGAAIGLKPTSTAAADKLKEIEGRELLERGDLLRAAGNMDGALALYNDAVGKWPALAGDSNLRIKSMQRAQPKLSEVLAAIDADVHAEKDASALARAEAALHNDPSDTTLKNMKITLESIGGAAAMQAEMQKLLDSSLEKISDARDQDDDDRNKEHRSIYLGMRAKCREHVSKARNAVLERNFDGALSVTAASREDLSDLVTQFESSAEFFDRRSGKAAEKLGVKLPIFSVGLGGDKGKSERYHRIADAFRNLAEQAKALKK